MSDFVEHNAAVCDFSSSDSWVILSPIELSIKRKIEAVGTPLRDWDIKIYRGVLTGCNEAFIISESKRNEILANCHSKDERNRTAELIRPILRGRDIKRYGYDWAGLYLIATFPSRNYDIEKYPAVKEYLLSYAEPLLRNAGLAWVADSHLADYCKQKLAQTGLPIEIAGKQVKINSKEDKARKKTGNKWFETQDSISYWEVFSPDFSLTRLTELSGIGYKIISQVINEKTGSNFNVFINEFRVKEACRLINDPENASRYTLEHIGEMVGFKSRPSFNAAFKRCTGMTPSAYQKIVKQSRENPGKLEE